MTTNLVQHAFHGQAVRVITDEHGDPLFVLADLCRVLDLGNPSMVATRIDPDALSQAEVTDSLGRRQLAYAVTEPGMYEVVIRSDKPVARDFRRWITMEVLPSIRRTGSYGAPALTGPELMARALIEAQATLTAQEERIAALEPPAKAWEALADASGDWSLRDAAQVLSRDPHIEIGQNRLAKVLRDDLHWLDRRGVPYQAQINTGRLAARARTYHHPRTGEVMQADPQVRITAKGLTFLHAHLGGVEPLDASARHLEVVS